MNPVDMIRQCETMDGLSLLWMNHSDEWRSLPVETGKEIIDEKNNRKKWLAFIADHPGQVEALEERVAIMEFDGGLTRAKAEEKTMNQKLSQA